MDTGTAENSNLYRLNGILQSRVDDLTEKLKLALQCQKEHLEELVRSQQIWRKDYSKLEEKYFILEREHDKLISTTCESNQVITELRESIQTYSRKLANANAETADFKNQLSVVRLQASELQGRLAEKDGIFAVLKDQFDIVGKEFVELKSFSDAERLENIQQIKSLAAEKKSLKDSVVQLEHKCRSQLETQQELNDLLHSLGQRVQAAETNLDLEISNAVETKRKHLNEIKEHEMKVSELSLRESDLVSRLSRAERDKSIYAQQSATLDAATSEKMQLLAENSRLHVEKTQLEASVDGMRMNLEHESAQKTSLASQLQELTTELQLLSLAHSEQQDSESNIRNQLLQAEGRLQQLVNESKVQLQQSSDRIKEVCAENSHLKGELATVKKSASGQNNELDESKRIADKYQRENEEMGHRYQVAYARVQVLEDQHELDVAKLESLEAELAEQKTLLETTISQNQTDLDKSLRKKQEEMERSFQLKLDVVTQEFTSQNSAAVEAIKAQSSHEMSKFVDLSVQALTKTYENTVSELRSELALVRKSYDECLSKQGLFEKDNSSLRNQLQAKQQKLSALQGELEMAAHSAKAKLIDVDNAHQKELKKMDDKIREYLNEINKVEIENNNNIKEREHLHESIRAEREEREILRRQLQAIDDHENKLNGKISKLEEELETSKQEVTNWSRKYAALMQTNDAEVQRVNKRIQVLTDTVARLTENQSKSDGLRFEEISREAKHEKRENDLIARLDFEFGDNEKSMEREQARWSQSPPSAQRRRQQLQRGKSAPAVMPLRLSSESVSNSVEKHHSPNKFHLEFGNGLDDYEGCDIEEINTNRDGDVLNSMRQALIKDIRATISNNNDANDASGESNKLSALNRARTAPSLRTPVSTGGIPPSWAVVGESTPSPVVKSSKFDVPVLAEPSEDSAKVVIDRIQSAINQRKGKQPSKQRGVVIRSKGLDKDRAFRQNAESIANDTIVESTTTPKRTVDFASAEHISPVSSTHSSRSGTNNFTTKLRSSIEEGENHWIPFSPQSQYARSLASGVLTPNSNLSTNS